MKVKTEIVLGQKVKDKVSGYTGIAVAKTDFLNGCCRISVQAPVGKDGKVPDQEWFDNQQIQVITKRPILEQKKLKTGGPGTNKTPQMGRSVSERKGSRR